MEEHANLTLHIRIDNKRELYQTALKRAIADGMTPKDARELLKPERSIDAGACLVMLLDPGLSPDGIEIIDSTVEVY